MSSAASRSCAAGPSDDWAESATAGSGRHNGGAPLRYAIDISPIGPLADPRAIVRLARVAEASGWDGISIWDVLGPMDGSGAADPFVALSAVAVGTERLRLITSIIALARRRTQLVVQAAATLDLVSDGRLILGLGAGEDAPDFEAFGESHEARDRIALMDEALAIVDAGLRGSRLDHDGPRLRARGIVLGPRPLQQPRPPIWLGALRPGGVRRAAHWEGWIAVGLSENNLGMSLTPDRLAKLVAVAQAEREGVGLAGTPFEVAVLGIAGPERRVAAYAEAGATWWLESLSGRRGDLDALEAIVRRGPPA